MGEAEQFRLCPIEMLDAEHLGRALYQLVKTNRALLFERSLATIARRYGASIDATVRALIEDQRTSSERQPTMLAIFDPRDRLIGMAEHYEPGSIALRGLTRSVAPRYASAHEGVVFPTARELIFAWVGGRPSERELLLAAVYGALARNGDSTGGDTVVSLESGLSPKPVLAAIGRALHPIDKGYHVVQLNQLVAGQPEDGPVRETVLFSSNAMLPLRPAS